MKIHLLIFFLVVSFTGRAQEKLTTFILVRHAEKVMDGSKNPDLSDEGKKRAERLVGILKNTSIDAVYSTDFTRTKSTIEPLAQSRNLSVFLYSGLKNEEIDKMVIDHAGKTILLCGHSNNIPRIANYLLGAETLTDFTDADYGNLLIVTVSSIGSGTLTWLSF
jgi:broad specificity phosphatase PhoE